MDSGFIGGGGGGGGDNGKDFFLKKNLSCRIERLYLYILHPGGLLTTKQKLGLTGRFKKFINILH